MNLYFYQSSLKSSISSLLILICEFAYILAMFQIIIIFDNLCNYMSEQFLFLHNVKPSNHHIINNQSLDHFLISTTFNSEVQSLVYLLYKVENKGPNITSKATKYQLYQWNITSNTIEFKFKDSSWNCSIKCQISSTGSFFLFEDQLFSYLYLMNQQYDISGLYLKQVKNNISLLNQTSNIRKKSDIYRNNYVFASGKDILAISAINQTIIKNRYSLPMINNFNPKNFVLDTKLYEDKIFILYRSIVTYNIYLYQFSNTQELFGYQYNNTQINQTKVKITEVFRFNNNYLSNVIRFVRGIDQVQMKEVIWAYNRNQAYKCSTVPCIGFGYEVYTNFAFTDIASTEDIITFYGNSSNITLKYFKTSLFSENIGLYKFSSQVYRISMNNYHSINRWLVASRDSIFPTVYTIADNCRNFGAVQKQHFCSCQHFGYSSELQKCKSIEIDSSFIFQKPLYILLVVIFAILIVLLIFIFYKKNRNLNKERKAWKYNCVENIIFQ